MYAAGVFALLTLAHLCGAYAVNPEQEQEPTLAPTQWTVPALPC